MNTSRRSRAPNPRKKRSLHLKRSAIANRVMLAVSGTELQQWDRLAQASLGATVPGVDAQAARDKLRLHATDIIPRLVDLVYMFSRCERWRDTSRTKEAKVRGVLNEMDRKVRALLLPPPATDSAREVWLSRLNDVTTYMDDLWFELKFDLDAYRHEVMALKAIVEKERAGG